MFLEQVSFESEKNSEMSKSSGCLLGNQLK